jgi:hypothetical protein
MNPLQGEGVAHNGDDSEGKKKIPVHPVLCHMSVVAKVSKVSTLVHIRPKVTVERTFACHEPVTWVW